MARGERARDTLRRLEVRPTKQRGQNFLVEPQALADILTFGAFNPADPIVEIGPGLGALTATLAQAERLTLIEIEEKFCAELAQKYPRARIVRGDIREIDLSALGSDLVVFGNLPYSLSTEIIFHLLAHRKAIRRCVLLLQREFTDRLAAAPGGRDYGVLSINAQMWADIRGGPVIPGSAFHPQAAVQSRVVELVMRSSPRVALDDPEWFQRVVRAAFVQRRRMLGNSLAASGLWSKEVIKEALAASAIDSNRRAETLSCEEFVVLSRALPSSRES